jgi:hypothetical protein
VARRSVYSSQRATDVIGNPVALKLRFGLIVGTDQKNVADMINLNLATTLLLPFESMIRDFAFDERAYEYSGAEIG